MPLSSLFPHFPSPPQKNMEQQGSCKYLAEHVWFLLEDSKEGIWNFLQQWDSQHEIIFQFMEKRRGIDKTGQILLVIIEAAFEYLLPKSSLIIKH